MEDREQFSLSWIDGITPKKLSIPLEFGSVIHHMLQHQMKASPREVANRVADQYWKYRSQSLTNSKERDTLHFILGLAKVTFPHYCNHHKADDGRVTWIGREEKFEVKHSVYGREVILRGMRDGMYEAAHDTFGIFETKTMSEINESAIVDRLHGDMQTLWYCFCTYLSQGRLPNQVLFNVIRRADLYRRKGEKDDQYLKRVEEDILTRPEHYFHRWRVWISPNDINTFVEKSLNPLLGLFIEWWDSVKKNPVGDARFQSRYHFLSYPALVGRYGKTEMWDAVFGNHSPYHIRDQVFPELSESFEVTWDDLETSTCPPELPRDLDTPGQRDLAYSSENPPWE